MAAGGPSTVARLEQLSTWLQTEGLGSLGSNPTALEECVALAALLKRERAVWQRMHASTGRYGATARIRALVSVVAACAHQDLLFEPVSLLHEEAALWLRDIIASPPQGSPNLAQVAVADALLRGQVLQGYSRQLSNLAAALASAPRAQGDPGVPTPHAVAPSTIRALLSPLACTVAPLAEALAVLGYHCSAYGWRSIRGRYLRAAGVLDSNAKRQRQQLGPRDLLLDVLFALSSSFVLEHAARGALALAVWLVDAEKRNAEQREPAGGRDAEEQQRQQQQQEAELTATDKHIKALMSGLASAYSSLSNLTSAPELLDGPQRRRGRRPPQGSSEGVQQEPAAVEAADLDDRHLCPLGARRRDLGSIHANLLRRILSGPCVRHLVLCMGMSSLRALDGGSAYGLQQGAGTRNLAPEGVGATDGYEVMQQGHHHQQQTMALPATPLLNLLTALAMRPRDPDAEPPGRATRLQLTLRVARAAAAAAAVPTASLRAAEDAGGSRGSSGGTNGSSQYVMDACDAPTCAVQALHFALRQLAPSGQQEGRRHRRAALRQWVVAAAEVASCGLIAQAGFSERAAYRLGLLLGLHPCVVHVLTSQGALRGSAIWDVIP